MDECLPKDHPLQPIFNRNTLKLSCSCMPSMKAIVDSRYKNLLRSKETEEKKCNCKRKTECPPDNQCLASGIVCQAAVKSDEKTETYVGLTDTPFKARYANHKQSLNKSAYKNQTKLSKHIW